MSDSIDKMLDDLIDGGDKPKKKNQQQKKQGQANNHAISMGSTFRIPWVYRVKVWVLRGFYALPLFGAFMMISSWNDWGVGWKTTIFAIVTYMIHFGCAAMVRFIDPEDWKHVEDRKKKQSLV